MIEARQTSQHRRTYQRTPPSRWKEDPSDETPNFAGDLGFRVFKLDTSNIRAWEPNPDDLEGTLLENIDHIKSDRSEEDILYELLLKLGLDLCIPIETRTIDREDCVLYWDRDIDRLS